MKRKLYRLIGLALCVSMGWALGYLRLPYIGKESAFWVGFIASLGFISLFISLLYIWNKNSLMKRFVGKRDHSSDRNMVQKSRLKIWKLLSLVLLIAGVISMVLMANKRSAVETKNENQSKIIQEQRELIESIKKSNQASMLKNILDVVDYEVANHINATLSDETIARIAALSNSFIPYRYISGDSLSANSLSPERGQLLASLAFIKMDTNSFKKIKQSTTFSYADLSGTSLKGADLRGVDLRDALLRDADLSGVDLRYADLQRANFWAAKLNGSNLSESNLKRAELKWAEINEANLSKANMDGINLSNAKLINTDLQGASIEWTKLDEAMFNDANFSGADLRGSSMIKANLTNSNLTNVHIGSVNFTNAILVGTKLSGAVVAETWLDMLNDWHVTGTKDLQGIYAVVADSSIEGKKPVFHIRKAGI